jgi:Fe(3+) dicitrate transport protein
VTVGCVNPAGWDAQIETVYVSEQFSEFANTAAAPANGNGQIGTIDAYTIFNEAMNYHLKLQRLSLFAAVKNIAENDYIVDRTRGIQTTMPRLMQVGANFQF